MVDCIMLGIKAGSSWTIEGIFFGKKQLIVIRLLAFFISPVTCRRRPDKIR